MRPPDRRAAAAAIDAFLRALGHDPAAEADLAGTGEQVARAFVEDLCDGYGVDVPALLAGATIASGGVAGASTPIVALHDVPVTTVCPHHLMTATGTASVAFAPRDAIVGLGTLARLLDAFAHRLALQERVGEQVAGALVTGLSARWAACRLVLRHGCVSAQGVRRHGAAAETVAFAGDPAERALGISVVRTPPRSAG